jgi:hypothetical protein
MKAVASAFSTTQPYGSQRFAFPAVEIVVGDVPIYGRSGLMMNDQDWMCARAESARLAGMESPTRQIHLVPPPDRRQSETALAIARGTARLLRSLGFACVAELPLPSGRRADLVALNERGEIWIVEIKSSVEDLRADQKWHEYRAHCDRLFFAFTADLPCEIFPADTGLIVADAYGAHMHCEAPEHRLPAATRKSMTVRFAMAAALRINRLFDPQGHEEI